MGVQTDIYPMKQTNILLPDFTAAHGNAKCDRGRQQRKKRHGFFMEYLSTPINLTLPRKSKDPR